MRRSVANGGSTTTRPSARCSSSSMYACTAVPLGYGLMLSVTSVAVARWFGSTAVGLIGNDVCFIEQASAETVHGLATPCSAAPACGDGGCASDGALSG